MTLQTNHSLRVLVADDDHSITKTFGWMLEILGYDSKVAHSGAEAIALADTFRISLAELFKNL